MREILFRGKTTDSGEWFFGSLVHQTDFYGDKVDDYYIVDGTTTEDNNIGYSESVRKETIGQYTGLKDKHGKKIFEGDVVKQTVDYGSGDKNIIIGVVKEDDVNPCFVIENKGDTEYDFIKCFCAELEIIGNIHDNPELLE